MCFHLIAQFDSAVYSKFTTLQNRTLFYKNLLNNAINKNLSLPLNEFTESKWQSAFGAIELINYQQPWVYEKIKIATDSIQIRSIDFQQSLLEMLYAGNRKEYSKQIKYLFITTSDSKVFAMSALYLLLCDTSKKNSNYLQQIAATKSNLFTEKKDAAIMTELLIQLKETGIKTVYPSNRIIKSLFAKEYLKGNVIVYSLQRKDRNYTGLTIIKDTAGNFVTDSNGIVFHVSQLARSVSNMPGYLTNGNTPQGIFRLYGFDKSRSSFIGPTENIQLTMPFETNLHHFLKNDAITDTSWSKELYETLLPQQLKNYKPLYQSFYTGAAGRTEIIAHGTTIDPHFYSGLSYYPYTPTAGCLCTKEIWGNDGKRIYSDQQKLINAVKQAGGADGYLIVLEINDIQQAVSLQDILPYLQ